MKKYFILLPFFLFSTLVFSQEDEWEDDDEDFSMYEDWGTDEEIKRFCTPKISGLSPAKLISVGYDFAGPGKLGAGQLGADPSYTGAQDGEINYSHGTRVLASIPVLSTNKWLINLGGNFFETKYDFASSSELESPLLRSLDRDPIRTAGLNAMIFKPLNEENFLLTFIGTEYSGNYNFDNLQSMSRLRHTVVAVYGWKPHERLQYGFGATQSYRAGEVNYFPIVMYNYTAPNKKWGIEALLPARGHYRRTFNSRTLLLAGFELEGTSYHLANRHGYFPDSGTDGMIPDYNANDLELRRSEIRFRLDFQKALSSFIWVSAQAGYIYYYRYDLDSGDFFRGFFGDQPYVMENAMQNTFYFQFSINLVSP